MLLFLSLTRAAEESLLKCFSLVPCCAESNEKMLSLGWLRESKEPLAGGGCVSAHDPPGSLSPASGFSPLEGMHLVD